MKVYQPLRRCKTQLSNINNPASVPSPTSSPYVVAPEYGSTSCSLGQSHTFWADGNPHETAMTTAWPPNKVILGQNGEGDLDLEAMLVTQGGPTYDAITARSYHPGGVNALFADGSVHFVQEFGQRHHLEGTRVCPGWGSGQPEQLLTIADETMQERGWFLVSCDGPQPGLVVLGHLG